MRDGLVAGLSQDFGVHPYGKWRGAFWLTSLAELGAGKDDPGALWACHPMGSAVEAVDRGRGAHALFSERAGDVLAAAGRT